MHQVYNYNILTYANEFSYPFQENQESSKTKLRQSSPPPPPPPPPWEHSFPFEVNPFSEAG